MKVIELILSFLIAFAITYLCCSFLVATIDITKWIPQIRLLNIVMCCFLTFVIFELINKEHKDNEDYY